MQDEHSLAHYILPGISGADAIVISASFCYSAHEVQRRTLG